MITEIEKKIRHINCLNNQITFKLVPAIYEAVSSLISTHGLVMDEYHVLVELSRGDPPSKQPDDKQYDPDNQPT